MRVLLVNTSERIGGAAISCGRLMEALKKNGIKAKMLVRDKQIDAYLVEFKATKHEIFKDGHLTVFRFTHPKSDYIFGHYPCFEFAYMDDFMISDMFKSEERGKGNRLYLAHTAHGMKCILFKNKPKWFGIDICFGKNKYEFSIGGGVQ